MLTSEEKIQIAKVILEQLGGRKFIVMTGARDLLALDSGLIFSLSATTTKNRINRVRITLTPADTYTIEFLAIHGKTVKEVYKAEDIYNDQLVELFEEHTGLFTKL